MGYRAMTSQVLNPNPTIHSEGNFESLREALKEEELEAEEDEFHPLEVFDMIRNINDPEHPLTLEQLKVTEYKNISVDNKNELVQVYFTPTIPHCSMATLIGLSIRVKLIRSLPSRFKLDVLVSPGSHASEIAVNKQLNDKERVAAALENSQLLGVINNCIAHTD